MYFIYLIQLSFKFILVSTQGSNMVEITFWSKIFFNKNLNENFRIYLEISEIYA